MESKAAPRMCHPLREVFSASEPKALQWLDELDQGPASLESLPGIVLLAIGLAERLDTLTQRDRTPMRIYEKAWFPIPPSLGESIPYQRGLEHVESAQDAALIWTRHWLILCMEEAFGMVLVEAVDVEPLLKRMRYAMSLHLYVSERFPRVCTPHMQFILMEFCLGAILLQCLTTLSRTLDAQKDHAHKRPQYYYTLWKFLEWSIHAHPLIHDSPLAQGLVRKLPALYYETCALHFQATPSSVLWAYTKACHYDAERYTVQKANVEKKLKRASGRVETWLQGSMTEEPDRDIRESVKIIQLKPHMMTIRTAIKEYLWIDDLLMKLSPDWFGQEFTSIQSAPYTLSTHHRLAELSLPQLDEIQDALDEDDDEMP